MKKVFPWFGILAVVIYVFTTILGAAIRPGYNHYVNAISELTSPGSPNLLLMNILFSIYNLLMLLFGAGLFFFPSPVRNWKIRTAGALLFIIGLFGALMYFFPMDARGTAETFQGTIHWVLAGILSLSTFTAALFYGIGISNIKKYKRIHVFSLAMAILIFFSGGFTAVGAQQKIPFFGLIERITIGSFLLWVMVLAISILKQKRKST
jgi:hypothetical membrane protein